MLTKIHRERRLQCITQWLPEGDNWTETVFSDETRFSLDVPDSWYTHAKSQEANIRQIRLCEGGGALIWSMVMPNGLISHKIIRGILKATDYLCLLKELSIPILKINFGHKFTSKEDNTSVNKHKVIRNFYASFGIITLKWTAKSPDINITEYVWRMISELVYDGPQFANKNDLEKSINDAIQCRPYADQPILMNFEILRGAVGHDSSS